MIATIAISLPLGLDGESITGNSTAIAVLSAVSIVAGYLLLFALWYFVFRDKRGSGEISNEETPSKGSDTSSDCASSRRDQAVVRIRRTTRPRFPRR